MNISLYDSIRYVEYLISYIIKALKGEFESKLLLRRPKTITDQAKAAIIQFVAENSETILSSLHQKFGHSKSIIRSILNQDKINYFPKNPNL